MNKWLPDRKYWAGGLTGVGAYVLIKLAQELAGITLTLDEAMALVGLLSLGVSYLTPPSFDDKIKRLDDDVRAWVKSHD